MLLRAVITVQITSFRSKYQQQQNICSGHCELAKHYSPAFQYLRRVYDVYKEQKTQQKFNCCCYYIMITATSCEGYYFLELLALKNVFYCKLRRYFWFDRRVCRLSNFEHDIYSCCTGTLSQQARIQDIFQEGVHWSLALLQHQKTTQFFFAEYQLYQKTAGHLGGGGGGAHPLHPPPRSAPGQEILRQT